MIELERHIEILLLSNDCVIIPDFGGFMAHHVDARVDDRDGMFLPPTRTIGFNPQLKMNDSLLALSYVEAYDISYPDAIARIADDVNEIKTRLENDGEYELNDIGTLRLSHDGSYSFEPCEAGVLTPGFYGLDAFAIQPIADIADIEEANDNHISGQTISATALTTSTARMEEEDEADSHSEFILIKKSWLRNAVAACIAMIVFLALSTPLNTPQSMQQGKIDTSLLTRIMPKDIVTGGQKAKAAIKATTEKTNAAATPAITDQTVSATPRPYYSIVLASHVTKRGAAVYTENLQAQGFKDTKVIITTGNVKVVYGSYDTEGEAYTALNKLHGHEAFTEGWITKIKE